MALIRSQDSLSGLTHEQCYMQGFQDCADSYDHDGREQASKAHRDLDGILDRCEQIAPWPLGEPPFDGDAA